MIVLSPEQAMSLFLYGSSTPPKDKLNLNLLYGPVNSHTSVDINDYMDFGPGRFVTAKDFDYVRRFFDDSYFAPKLDAGEYSDVEIREKLGGTGFIRRYQTALTDNINDLTERSFVWESVAFEIKDDAGFVVLENGAKFIKNFGIIPFTNSGDENFDFNGGLLDLPKENFDPFGIGELSQLVLMVCAHHKKLHQQPLIH
jgi:hypothetical protein